MAFGVLLAGSTVLISGQSVFCTHGVVFKPMRPPKMTDQKEARASAGGNLKNLPDPFLSYLVKKVQRDSAQAALEKQKQQEAAEKLERLKAQAAEKLRRLREPKTELQRLNLHQLTLTAIINTGNKSWAMVRDEKGMGYILKKGTAIGTKGGRVDRVSLDRKEVFVKVPYLEKEIEIKYKTKVIELPDEEYD